jgi:hypothetical protein
MGEVGPPAVSVGTDTARAVTHTPRRSGLAMTLVEPKARAARDWNPQPPDP